MNKHLLAPMMVVALTGVGILNWLGWQQDRRAAVAWRDKRRGGANLVCHPSVSILLPAWNEERRLASCLNSLLRLRYPAVEIIVCAGGKDKTVDIARRYEGERMIVLDQWPGEGKQKALQRAYEHSSGDIIFLTDADCVMDDDTFEATIAPLVGGPEEASTGFWEPLQSQQSQPFVQHQWAHHLHREMRMPIYADTLDGRNAAVRRSALEITGAFRAEAPIGTDYVLSRQLIVAGLRIRAVHGSRVQTEYPETYEEYRRQQSRWFRNRLVLGSQTRSWADVAGSLRAAAGALLLLGAPLVGIIGFWPVWALWPAMFTHVVLGHVRVRGRVISANAGWPGRAWSWDLPLHSMFGSLVMAAGLIDALFSRRRRTW